MSQNNYKKLLIMTVGGSPDQIRKSIKYWKPKRILFICSPKSREDLNSKFDSGTDFDLRKDEIDFIVLDDYQNIQKNIEQIKDKAEFEHKKWIKNGKDYISILDITGGSKSMSASLALIAYNWKQYIFSYVGDCQG